MKKINIEGIEQINDSNVLNQLRQDINEAIDKRIEKVKIAEFAKDLSEKPFGYLKECFEAMAPSLYSYSDGKKVLSKYAKVIKENKNLKQLHTIYENVRSVDKNSDLTYFFEHFAGHDWKLDSKKLKEDVKKLGDVIAEAYLFETFMGNEINLPAEDAGFNYAVEYIVENKMNGSNLSKYSSALKIIKEHVERNENTSFDFSKIGKEQSIDNMIKEFNDKYSDLNEEEAKIVNEIISSKNPEDVFNSYKEKCKSKIEEKKQSFEKENDVDSVKRINTIIEQISKKAYSEETLADDINNMIEISNIFD